MYYTNMERDDIVALIANHHSIRKMAAARGCSQSTIKHWLKVHGLKTATAKATKCSSCGETDRSLFNERRKTTCKKCWNIYILKRWIRIKWKAIEYKGGACERCGYKNTEHYSVYDFHHKHGTEKKFGWPKLRRQSWSTIKAELDKCELLCSNCHRIEHEDNFNQTYHTTARP